MNSVLNLILSHQSSRAVSRMLAYWSEYVPAGSILLAYGGPREEFDAIAHRQKCYVDDSRLRTSDHQREFQSYSGLFQQAAAFLATEGTAFRFVHFAEYDHLPLVADLNARQVQLLRAEDADVLAFHLHRVDGTNHPHFLYHAAEDRFHALWAGISRRSDPKVVLSIFGSGSFWTREAFLAVSSRTEPFRMYLEIYLPTLAHHLGFRVRGFGVQDRFIDVLGDETDKIEAARAGGAWTLHPAKRLWTD